METQILIYLLKASMAFVVFYLLYLLCLRNDTLLNIRRFYFLFIILFSLTFPLVNIELGSEQYNALPGFLLSAVTVTANGSEAEVFATDTTITSISFQQIVMVILISGSSILFMRFIIQLVSLLRLRIGLKQECKGIFRYVYLEKESQPSSFSFFNWIFLNSNDSKAENNEILVHEEEHARQLHSIDVLLIEATCVLFWWNPFVWMLRNELKANLEYLADRGVVNKGYSSYEYQYTLLQTINNNAGIPLINNFNVSQLKKRITMMNKERTPILGSVKYLLALPILALLLMFNCSNDKKNNANEERLVISNAPVVDVSVADIPEGDDMISSDIPVKEQVYMTVEQMPQYPGGEKEMYTFISKILKYPPRAQTEGVQGRVITRFVVDKTGEIKDTKILRGIDPECDKEALRIVQAMPKWTPGKQNGNDVSVYFTLPIVFKLQ